MPIFDQGYQHWRGPLSGQFWRWLTIARQGTRVQMKSRNLRALMFFAWLPALALVIFMALWGLVEKKSEGILALLKNVVPPEVLVDPHAFRSPVWTLAYSYFFQTQIFFIMLLVVVAGPGLISRDLRFNALPLYLARPLTRLDYFLGKLGVIGALVASVAVGPAVLAYFMGLCFSLDPSVIKETWTVLLASVAYGLIVTLSAGMLMLALSSLTRRSLYVGIAWAGLWIISGMTGTIMTELHRESRLRGIIDDEMTAWQKDHPRPANGRVGNWQQAHQLARQRAMIKLQEGELESLRHEWRPLFSYTGNLERIADQLFDTDAAWVAIGKAAGPKASALGPKVDERTLANRMVPQYPWQWSAGVLAGLLGLSTWTLTRRVKSLDRLK